jgi:CHAT domain-containing protein/tetratricopeptide (TPR) repeat protein
MRWIGQALTPRKLSICGARFGLWESNDYKPDNGFVPLRVRRAVAKVLVMAMLIVIASPGGLRAQSDADIAALKQHGFELYQAGKYAEALPVAKQYAEFIKGRYGAAHSEYATALFYIAEVLRASSRLTEAELLYRQALSIGEKSLGADDPKLTGVLDRLVEIYFSQGRYGEAELHMKRQLLIREKTLWFDRSGIAANLVSLANIYRVQTRFPEAEPLMRRALAIDETTFGKDHPNVAAMLGNLALLLQDTNRLAEAEPLLRRALAIDEANYSKDDPHLAIRLNNLAQLLENTNRLAEAEPLMRRTLAIDEAAFDKDHPSIATALNNLAHLLQATNRRAEAEPLMRRALAIYEANFDTERPNVAKALNNLASLLQATNRLSEAEPLMRRALAIDEVTFGKDHPEVGIRLNNLALLLQAMNRPGEAELLLRRALAIDEVSLGKDHPNVAIRLNNLAALQEQRGNWVAAIPLYKLAMASVIGGQESQGLQKDGIQKAVLTKNTGNFRAYARALYHADRQSIGNRQEGFEVVQWALQNAAGDALLSMAARFAKGNGRLAEILRKQQDMLTGREGSYRRLDEATGKADAKAANIVRATIAEIEAALDKTEMALRTDFPDYADLASPKPLSIRDTQALLGENQALVVFLDVWNVGRVPEETLVFTITKNEARWVRSELGTPSLTHEVTALRCGLDAAAWDSDGADKCAELLKIPRDKAPKDRDLLPFDLGRSHALYKTLFGEVEDLIKGKSLIIVPTGPLTQLPFQVLVTKPPKSGDYKSAAWLVRDHVLTVLPAVSSLKALRRVAHQSAATKPMIGFGNPLLDGPDGRYADLAMLARNNQSCATLAGQQLALAAEPRGGMAQVETRGGFADVAVLRKQVPLPETAFELCSVARDVHADPDEIRLGARATEHEVKALSASGALAQYRIVHFATHGALAGQVRGNAEPGLLLTPPAVSSEEDDGYLSASEIAGVKLDADWVILSACNTAAGGTTGAEALSGIARAFFYAQARALLVSHWEVNSDATVKLVTAAVREISRHKRVGRAEALRRAMLALIDKGKPYEAHPAYWAPFVVVGEGAAAR